MAAGEQEIGDSRQAVLVGLRANQLTRQRFRRDIQQRADEEARSSQPLFWRGVGVSGDAKVGKVDAFSKTGFAQKARDGCLVRAKLLPQDFDGDRTVRRVFGSKHGGRSAFTHFGIEGVARNCLTYEIFTWHGANLTVA